MAAPPRLGRAPSQQSGTYGSLPSAAVPSASQVGNMAGPLRLGDVVLLYAEDSKSYVFSDISRCVATVAYVARPVATDRILFWIAEQFMVHLQHSLAEISTCAQFRATISEWERPL